MVSPRKSRRKSLCFSRTATSTPARASRKPSTIPAGPPPAIQQRTSTLYSVSRMALLSSVFTVRETHGRVFRPGNRLIAHSQDVGWRSIHAAIIEEAPFHATESAIPHPSLIYHLTRPTEVTRRIEGTRGEKALIGPRRICLTPGDVTTSWQHSGHPEILQVYLR